MTVVISNSLYPVQGIAHRFYHGNPYHCVSAKVSLRWDGDGRLYNLPRQPEIERNDVWHGRENRSSLRCASELIPYKPATDVLVSGSVRPPDGRPARAWAGALIVAGREKRLRFFGPREWRHGLLSGWRLSEPEPCSEVALLYENAYGGVSDTAKEQFEEGEYYAPNPQGCGWLGRCRADTEGVHRAPQIESWHGVVSTLGHDVAPGGFGPLPGYFPERSQYMGSWSEEAASIPSDMDLRYWNVAPPDQRSDDYLKPGATIALVGLRPGNPLSLALPPFDPSLLCEFADRRREALRMNLDTVTVDLDREHLVLRYQRIVPWDEALERITVNCAPYRALSGEVRRG